MWPAVIVQQLYQILPDGFVAEPRVRLGAFFEIDIGTLESGDAADKDYIESSNEGGVATAMKAAPRPTWSVETELPDEYEYEVLIFDQQRDRELVAAIEIVSPANKDRPRNRQAFITKCLTLLQKGVCVSIIDLITTRQINLYAEMLQQVDLKSPELERQSGSLYVVTVLNRKSADKSILDNWYYPMELGKKLPSIPVWLSEESSIMVDLEPGYEEVCRVLRIV